MLKINVKNERIKRAFFRWLKEADGCCDSTVNAVEKGILLYQEFTKNEDFALYNSDRAIDFKKWLLKRENNGKGISIVTYHTYLRYLRKFFGWLCWQSGYKSKITPDLVDYLRITEKEERIATQITPRNYPQLDYVVKLAKSIQINSEIDLRDRALIAFTLLSGMRDKAIVTLPISCFDEESLTVNQNPKKGVETKFSKLIPTTLFRFDEELLGFVKEWIKHLKAKGFGSQDPLFPRSKVEQGINNLSFETSSEVEPVFWQGTSGIRDIFRRRSSEAKLPYFPPHTFRHLAIDLALKYCKTGEQIKAISQNFGHEHIATTLSSYANYDPRRLSTIIQDIEFSGKINKDESSKLEEIRKILYN